MLEGPEGGVDDVGYEECQDVSEKRVEEVDEVNSNDDCMVR